jgi:hypothetical protein
MFALRHQEHAASVHGVPDKRLNASSDTIFHEDFEIAPLLTRYEIDTSVIRKRHCDKLGLLTLLRAT